MRPTCQNLHDLKLNFLLLSTFTYYMNDNIQFSSNQPFNLSSLVEVAYYYSRHTFYIPLIFKRQLYFIHKVHK